MAKLGRRQEYIRSSNIKAVMRALRNGGKTFAELEEKNTSLQRETYVIL